jgi:hypothetical protein
VQTARLSQILVDGLMRPITRIIAAHRLLRDSPSRELHGVQVPDEVVHDEALNEAISVLPANYNFEVRLTRIPLPRYLPQSCEP